MPRGSAEALAAELGAPPFEGAVDKRPVLCVRDTTQGAVLGDGGFVFEVKWDGVRIAAIKDGDRATLSYRSGRSASGAYPEVVRALAALPHHDLVLDGEIVALGDDGAPDFQRLGSRIHRGRAETRGVPPEAVSLVVFDVPFLSGRDLRGLPLESRRAVLEQIMAGAGDAVSGTLALSPQTADGRALFRACAERGLEGVVAKRKGTPYPSGARSDAWVKVKCEREESFLVVGYTESVGARRSIAALHVASREGRGLVYRGRVGSGLSADFAEKLLAILEPLRVASPVLALPNLSADVLAKTCFTEAACSVRVRYLEQTADGALRHPVLVGLEAAAPADRPREDEDSSAGAWAVGLSAPAKQVAALARAAGTLLELADAVGVSGVCVRGRGEVAVVLGIRSAGQETGAALAALLVRWFEAALGQETPVVLRLGAEPSAAEPLDPAALSRGAMAPWPPPEGPARLAEVRRGELQIERVLSALEQRLAEAPGLA